MLKSKIFLTKKDTLELNPSPNLKWKVKLYREKLLFPSIFQINHKISHLCHGYPHFVTQGETTSCIEPNTMHVMGPKGPPHAPS